jgi:hypothetical protein
MKQYPDRSTRKEAQRTAREERLAQALRANLRRRKEQAQAQAQAITAGGNPGCATTLSNRPLSSKSTDDGGTIAD